MFAYGTHPTRDIFLQSPPFVVGMGCSQLSFEIFYVLHQRSNFASEYIFGVRAQFVDLAIKLPDVIYTRHICDSLFTSGMPLNSMEKTR